MSEESSPPQKIDATNLPAEVYDEDAEQWVEVSTNEEEYAQSLHEWVQMGTLVTGLALKAIRDHEAYRALGCSSFKEYCNTMAPFTRQTAYNHIKRVERYAPFLPDAFSPEAVKTFDSNPLQMLTEGISGDGAEGAAPVPSALGDLSNGKLDALGELDDDTLAGFIEEEELTAPDGRKITRAQLAEMTTKEVQRRVEAILQPHKDKIDEEKEKRLKAEAERDALQEELDEREEEIEAAQDLQETWGPAAAQLKEKRRRMKLVEDALEVVGKHLYKLGISTDDPIPDQNRAVDIYSHIERLASAAREETEEVMINPDRMGDL